LHFDTLPTGQSWHPPGGFVAARRATTMRGENFEADSRAPDSNSASPGAYWDANVTTSRNPRKSAVPQNHHQIIKKIIIFGIFWLSNKNPFCPLFLHVPEHPPLNCRIGPLGLAQRL
jgi:hypothetical protein